MIQTQIALIRRELLEHRSIYVTPIVIGLIVSLMSITGQVAISGMDHAVDIALLGATNLGVNERATGITLLMSAISSLFLVTMWILTIFYALDALYAERKDRSILFWRSLPITDAETVISKLLTVLLVIPLVTLGLIMVTHILVLTISSIWVGVRGVNAWHLIWTAVPLFDNWTVTLITVLALPLWLAPFVGWFLFVSAFTKRSPFLTAFLPLIVLPMLEKILLGSSFFAEAFLERSAKLPLFANFETSILFFQSSEDFRSAADAGISLLSMVDLGRFLSNPGLWAGFVVCGLFTAGAIYVRRFRDET